MKYGCAGGREFAPRPGNSRESFSSNQETGKVFSPEMHNIYSMENGGHPAWDVCCTGLVIDTHGYVGYVDGDVYIDRLCLLGRSGVENIMQRNEEYVDVRGLSHRHTVSWDPGVAESRPSRCVMIACV